jgi:two-component system chemotaxis response regulator CheB
MAEKISVLIVDDSPLVRESIRSALDSEPEIEVIGTACNGEEGVRKAVTLRPKVITMDLRMPVMDGFEAIERIMQEEPTPIIVVSSMDNESIGKTLDMGVMDILKLDKDINDVACALIEKVKIASRVKAMKRARHRPESPRQVRVRPNCPFRVAAIGISTGGPQALRILFSGLNCGFPVGLLIVQHMSPGFIEGMADWLNSVSAIDVRVAWPGAILRPSSALIAPDCRHMEIDGDARIHLVEETEGRSMHIPSIDRMMKSVACAFGVNAIGVIMTGMGRDGVEGLKAIKKAGGLTIAQDESTSAIFGMNRVAIEEGIVDKVLPADEIAGEILATVYGKESKE